MNGMRGVSAGVVQIQRRNNVAGPVYLTPVAEHRLCLHLSATTSTACSESGRRFVRLRGDIDVIPARESGGFEAERASASLDVYLASGLVEQVAAELGLQAGRAALRARHMLRDPRLSHLVWAIEAGQQSDGPGGRLYLESLGVALAVQLLAGDHGLATTRVPPRNIPRRQLQRVIEYIEANLESDLSLQRLSDVAGVSSSHLQRAFQVSQNVSLHRYVVLRRVERARTLLLQGTLPASQVALVAGFSHQSHMARWIRRLTGVTPRDMRKN